MAVISKFMEKLGIGSSEPEYDEYEDTEEITEDEEEEVSRPRRSFSNIEKDYSQRSMQTKVIPMETAVSSSKMVITEPSCYESVQEIGEYLKSKKSSVHIP